eukprot:COSAG01_NODE_7782_length_3049_cov_2.460317_2_plen_177_part_00
MTQHSPSCCFDNAAGATSVGYTSCLAGQTVYVPVDAVASRAGREADSDAAVAQLEAAGAVITTAEAVLWQLVPGARTFPAFMRSTLTEIYLCHACSCQTRGIEDGNARGRSTARALRGGGGPPGATERRRQRRRRRGRRWRGKCWRKRGQWTRVTEARNMLYMLCMLYMFVGVRHP